MNNAIYLITGPSGSGKTEVANYLAARGYQTIEADSTPGLCYFVNKNNKPVPYPTGADAAWWESHNYVWEADRLKKHISAMDPTKPVFLCGNAGNIAKIWPLFAAVFYLDIPTKVMLGRIGKGRRDHSFGQRMDESDQLMRWAEPFKQEMLGLGAVTIDATKPVNQVADAVLAHIKASA